MELGAIERILMGAGGEAPTESASQSNSPLTQGGPHGSVPGPGSLRGHAFLTAAQKGPNGNGSPARHPLRRPSALGPGPAPTPPRTAFLRTRIAPAVRPGPGTSTAGTHPAGLDAQRNTRQGTPRATPPAGPLDLLDSNEPLLTAEELDAFFNPLPEGTPSDSTGSKVDALNGHGEPQAASPSEVSMGSPHTAPGELAEATRPTWLKRQVADLADLVQALDMRARSNHSHLAFEEELARLRQFTRTIGFVASPPPRGIQTFDMGDFVEEQLGQIAGQSPDAPRLLFRRRGPEGAAEVTADRPLVALSLDALLQTAVACSSSGDVVRVSVEGGGPAVTARVDFPAGPMAGLHPAEIQRPYALRAVLPEIGPNAIAAAGAIAVGQGGDLTLEELSKGRLAFTLSLH